MWASLLLLVAINQPIQPKQIDIPVVTVDISITIEAPEIPRSDIYSFLATASHNINQLPDDITRSGSQSLIPNSDSGEAFGYAKWLFSTNSANELLGVTLAPVGLTLFVLMTIFIASAIVQMLIRVIVPIMKVVIWLIQQVINIVKLLPFI